MSRFPGYTGIEGEGYFDGYLEETYLFTDFAVDFVYLTSPQVRAPGNARDTLGSFNARLRERVSPTKTTVKRV